jgi:hypothetical protein
VSNQPPRNAALTPAKFDNYTRPRISTEQSPLRPLVSNASASIPNTIATVSVNPAAPKVVAATTVSSPHVAAASATVAACTSYSTTAQLVSLAHNSEIYFTATSK